jgi:hypothetical protein
VYWLKVLYALHRHYIATGTRLLTTNIIAGLRIGRMKNTGTFTGIVLPKYRILNELLEKKYRIIHRPIDHANSPKPKYEADYKPCPIIPYQFISAISLKQNLDTELELYQ